jgi:hypothetical protein
MELSGQLHAPAALPPGKEPPLQYPLYRKLGGPQSWSGHGVEEKNSQPSPEIEYPLLQSVVNHYTTDWSIPAHGLYLSMS